MYEAILLSLKITGISTLITGITGILTAYIFTKYNFKFKNILETIILMPMALPPTVVGYLIILIIGKRGFLGQFLYKYFGVNILFTHGSPNAINEYLFEDAENTKKVMTEYEGDVLVCAHTHIPFTKKFNNKTLINVGSVGKPKIGKPNPTYTIIEIKDNGEIVVQVRYLEYEYKRIMKDCTMLNFPTAITSSYETGKES